MALIRSLTTGTTSLQAHQQRLDVISNNIANVNTVGYKASEATFVDQLSQVMNLGVGPSNIAKGGSGGVDPLQIGLGVRMGAVRTDFSQGSIRTTNRALDVAITGDAFFALQSNGSMMYSRAGNFSLDKNGNLVDSVSGTAGTATGSTFTKGFEGQSLQGVLNGYVLATPSTAIKSLQSFTSTLWINTPPPSTGIIGFLSLANTVNFWGNIDMFFENGSVNTNGKVRIHITQGTNDYTFAVDNVQNLFGSWVNIAFSYDAATSKCTLYVNGSSVSSGTIGGLTGALNFTSVGKLVFGCVQFQTTPSQTSATGSQGWASFLTGTLDEVRIYNKALAPTDISAIVALEAKGK